MYKLTTATKKIRALKKRIRGIQGGTSASKTVSVVLYLIDLAQRDEFATTTSIVSESLPHLRKGAIKDFLSIMQQHGYYKDASWNVSNSTYTFETGSIIEFFSVDQSDKVRGPRRDRLFINEANNITYDTFDQLEVRTKEFIILDWNPTNEFWFYTEVKGERDDVDHLILTYLDNEALDPAIVKSIEMRKHRKGWWKVYGEGKLGEVEGKIYKGWKIVNEIPEDARLERYGIDFGYSNDETAIIAIYYYNGAYILDEICYLKEQSNRDIADILKNLEPALTIADSAEPKSIAEIKTYGIKILPAQKGPDSINNGIQLVQDQKMKVTVNSTNILKEYRNYLWQTDKNGKILNVPEGGRDHAMDAARYALSSIIRPPKKGVHVYRPGTARAHNDD